MYPIGVNTPVGFFHFAPDIRLLHKIPRSKFSDTPEFKIGGYHG